MADEPVSGCCSDLILGGKHAPGCYNRPPEPPEPWFFRCCEHCSHPLGLLPDEHDKPCRNPKCKGAERAGGRA